VFVVSIRDAPASVMPAGAGGIVGSDERGFAAIGLRISVDFCFHPGLSDTSPRRFLLQSAGESFRAPKKTRRAEGALQ